MRNCRIRLLCALLVVSAGMLRPFPARSAVEVVPYFKEKDILGVEVSLGDLVARKRVVIFFWDWRRATSTREMNFLARLYDRYAKQGLEIIAVEGEGVESDQVVERIDKMCGTTLTTCEPAVERDQIVERIATPRYIILPDPGGRLARQFRVESTPQTILIDGAGRVAFHLEGFRAEDEEILEIKIRELLGITPPPAPPPAPPTAPPPVSAPGKSDIAPVPPPEQAPAEDPRKVLLERYRYFGNYHMNRNELAKAEEYYRKYLELAPEDTAVLLKLGEVYAAQASYDRAREIWETVLRLDPRNAEADVNIRRLIRGEY